MACSPLIAMALRRNRLPGLLIGYAIFGAILVVTVLFAQFGVAKHEKAIESAEATPLRVGRGVTIALSILFFTYVGMETSIVVWAAEYSRRIENVITNITTLAPLFFYVRPTIMRALARLVLLSLS